MNRSTWKRHEREWAELLGGKRVPVSGRQRGDQPDVAHPDYSIECKAGAVLSTRLLTGMEQAIAAMKDGQIPLVCISNRKKGGQNTSAKYVLMRAEDFVELATKPATKAK